MLLSNALILSFVLFCQLLLDCLIGKEVVIRRHAVDDAVWREVDDAVGYRLDKLVVVRDEEKRATEGNQPIVKCCDGFEVEMVGRLIQQQNIRARKHHAAEHTADALTAGKDACFLLTFLTGKEHAPKKATDKGLIGVLRILAEPIDDVQINTVKVGRVVAWKIGLRRRNAPLERSLIGSFLTHENLEEHGLSQAVRTDKSNLVAAL